MSDADAPSGHGARFSTIPRERRTGNGPESLPEPSLAEALAADAVAVVGRQVPAAGRLWSATTWDRLLDALAEEFADRLRCRPRPRA